MANRPDAQYWFEPKPDGNGAGAPIHPNGWRLLWAYIGGMLLSALIVMLGIPSMFGLMIPKTYGYGWTLPGWALVLFLALWLALCVAPLTWAFNRLVRAHTRGGGAGRP